MTLMLVSTLKIISSQCDLLTILNGTTDLGAAHKEMMDKAHQGLIQSGIMCGS
jgi:hypothetical protein